MKRSALKFFVPIILTLCTLACGIGVPGAAANPKPFVSLALTPTVNESNPIPFSWSAKRLGSNHRLVIQRPFGTAKVWKTIMKLPANTGSAELRGRTLGTYRYRIAAFRGRKFLAAQVARVSVYGIVPLAALLNGGDNGSYTTDKVSFPYVWERSAEKSTVSAFSFRKNNCSSVHISFLPGEKYESGNGVLTVVQESTDPVSASVPFEQTGTVDATLVPGQTWGVNINVVSPEDPYVQFYINGFAICSSTESAF